MPFFNDRVVLSLIRCEIIDIVFNEKFYFVCNKNLWTSLIVQNANKFNSF